MRKAGRSDINLAFERLNGQSPNDEQIRRMLDIGNALGIADNDALWHMIMFYEHLISKILNLPALMAEAAKKVLDQTSMAAEAVVRQKSEKRCTLEAEAPAVVAQDFARGVTGQSYARSVTIAFIVAFVSLSAAGWLGWYSGYKAGHADGYAETQDERANASWGNSAQGKKARRLADAGSLDKLADCSGPGWYREGDECMPAELRNVGTFGWHLGRHS